MEKQKNKKHTADGNGARQTRSKGRRQRNASTARAKDNKSYYPASQCSSSCVLVVEPGYPNRTTSRTLWKLADHSLTSQRDQHVYLSANLSTRGQVTLVSCGCVCVRQRQRDVGGGRLAEWERDRDSVCHPCYNLILSGTQSNPIYLYIYKYIHCPKRHTTHARSASTPIPIF